MSSTQLEPPRPTSVLRPSATAALARRQATWVATQAATALGLSVAGLWASQPELALSLSLGAGAGVVNPRRAWALPLVLVGVTLAGLLAGRLDWPPIVFAGAAAGLAAMWLLPEGTDWLDAVNGALATALGATVGLWTAHQVLPDLVSTTAGALVCAAIVGLVASQGLIPAALRFDRITVPSHRLIRKTLEVPYRAPALRAVELYAITTQVAPDAETRRGLAEVATWVYRLQLTLRTLDRELAAIEPQKVEERIAACEADDNADPFTRERRQATAQHLRRLLDHRRAIAVERQRADALVDYALAFLEEARAGLAVARELPGEASPDRLPEVLHRLRTHAAEGDTRRKTAREMGRIDV